MDIMLAMLNIVTAIIKELPYICVFALATGFVYACIISELKNDTLDRFCSGDKDKLVFMYAEKSKVFHRIKYECIEVSISQLGEKTKKKLYDEVQQPLVQLWKNSDKKDYCVLTPYIQSIGDDVQKAVKNCFNKEDEKVLRSRLPVLTESIEKMQDVIREIRGGKEDTPFRLVENMNQLQQKS